MLFAVTWTLGWGVIGHFPSPVIFAPMLTILVIMFTVLFGMILGDILPDKYARFFTGLGHTFIDPERDIDSDFFRCGGIASPKIRAEIIKDFSYCFPTTQKEQLAIIKEAKYKHIPPFVNPKTKSIDMMYETINNISNSEKRIELAAYLKTLPRIQQSEEKMVFLTFIAGS